MELKKPKLKPLALYETEDLRKYAVLPLHAIKNKNITGENLRVLAIICASANRAGLAYASQRFYGEQLGVSAQAINEHIKKLKKAGLITMKRNYYPGIKGNSIRVLFDLNATEEEVQKIAQDKTEVLNKDIAERLKANQLINKVNKLDNEDQVYKVDKTPENIVTFELVLEYVSQEHEILQLERMLQNGYDIKRMYEQLKQGIKPAELVDIKGFQEN